MLTILLKRHFISSSKIYFSNILVFTDFSLIKLVLKSPPTPVKTIEKNGRSFGVRTLQNRSNGLNDVLIRKLNTVIVPNDVRSLRRSWHLNVPAVN